MQKICAFLFISFFLQACSCSQDEEPSATYGKLELMIMIKKADPNAREILPKDMNSGVKCADYGPGCIRGLIGNILGYDVIFVEFETENDARNEAIRLEQLYARNWLIDDTAGEPPLEKFFKQVIGAINPNEKTELDGKETSGETDAASASK